MTPLIDTHIHFDDDRFDHDRDTVFNNAIASGINEMVIPATTQQRWEKIFTLAEQYPNVHPSAGLHPIFIAEHTHEHLELLETTLANTNCVAVGECGLDRFFKNLDYTKQQTFFAHQIELAIKFKLPLIIHARNAVQDVTLALKSASNQTTGVIHSYNGSLQQAEHLIDLGYLLSFGGAVTYQRATRLREIVKALPLNKIMVETDAPHQPDQSHTGKRNEPAYLNAVVTAIAEIKNITPETLAESSNSNARSLFNLPSGVSVKATVN